MRRSRFESEAVDSEVLLEGVNLRELFVVLRGRWLVVLFATLLTVGLTGLFFAAQPAMYSALGLIRLTNARNTITIAVENNAAENVSAPRADPALSQVEVMRGLAVLGRVVDETGELRLEILGRRSPIHVVAVRVDSTVRADTLHLRLDESEVVASSRDSTVRAPYGQPLVFQGMAFTVPAASRTGNVDVAILGREAAIDRLGANLTIAPRALTDAIEISFVDSDPFLAQRVVNTLIRVAQESDIEGARQQSRRRRLFVEEQLKLTDSLLTVAQLALSNFRSGQQIYSSREKITVAQQGIMNLDVSRGELNADRSMIESLLEQLRRAAPEARERTLRTILATPGIASNGVVSQLFGQLALFESRRDSLTSGSMRSTSADPDVSRLNVQIGATQAKLVDAVESYLASLSARIAALDDLRSRGARDIQQLPGLEASEVRLVQQVDAVSRVGNQLRDELQKARMAEAIETGRLEIVYAAPTPLKPVARHLGVKLGLALLLGLLSGGAIAFVREHMDTTVRRREELESVLHVTGLAIIPRMLPAQVPKRKVLAGTAEGLRRLPGPQREGRSGDRILMDEPVLGYSAAEEAYRILRTNLNAPSGSRPVRSIVVTSAFAGEGKTTVASNLAVSFARRGTRTLLIDSDMRCGRLHDVLQVERVPGLADLLTQSASVDTVIRATEISMLSVLPAGSLIGNPADALASEYARTMLERLAARFDMVILDSPPVFAAADAAILGRIMDGTLLVVRAGQTDRHAAAQAVAQLSQVGANVLGAVLNDPDDSVPSYGQYYYSAGAVPRPAT